MTTYAVMFFNRNTHKVQVECFTAGSEGEARHDFRECYRHGKYTIFAVVPVPEMDEQPSDERTEKSETMANTQIEKELTFSHFAGESLSSTAEDSVLKEVDNTIAAVAKRIQNDSAPEEYANIVKALAALVEARASLMPVNVSYKKSEMTKNELFSHLPIKDMSELICEMAKVYRTPKEIEVVLRQKLTEEELQKINSAARKSVPVTLDGSFIFSACT